MYSNKSTNQPTFFIPARQHVAFYGTLPSFIYAFTRIVFQRDALKRRGGVAVETPVDECVISEGRAERCRVRIPECPTKKTCVAQRKRAVKTPSLEPSTSQV